VAKHGGYHGSSASEGFHAKLFGLDENREEGENPPEEQASAGIGNGNKDTNVGETGHMNENDIVLETVNEGVEETVAVPGNESLAYNEVVHALEQMIDAGSQISLMKKTERSWRR
jgi:hypothetical protein